MDNLLKIYEHSEHLQTILEPNDVEKNINDILKQEFNILNLNITYEKYIEYLLNLTNDDNDYNKIQFTEENIAQHCTLYDYFLFNNQYDFLDFVFDTHISKQHIFYDKLYLNQPFNNFILLKISKENDVDNETFKYIFETNENICNEIITLCSEHIEQNLLNRCLNITDLNICNNKKITNVNHLKFLINLNISWECGVDQKGILQLKFIKKLNACDNNKITNINHLLFLEELDMSFNCGIIQKEISSNLNIVNLHTNNFDNTFLHFKDPLCRDYDCNNNDTYFNTLLKIHNKSEELQSKLRNKILYGSDGINALLRIKQFDIEHVLHKKGPNYRSELGENMEKHELYFKCLVYLTYGYKNIKYTSLNIRCYAMLSEYFMFDDQHEFFDFIIDKYIKRNMFYDKLYYDSVFQFHLLNVLCRKNDISNNTIAYIFETDENTCKKVLEINSQHISQKLLDKCVNMLSLNICNNNKITNVKCLKSLSELTVSNNCRINLNDISQKIVVTKLNE